MTDQNIRSIYSGPNWKVQEAKARFSELLDAGRTEGPQIITRRGAEIAAVVPIEQWRRLESAVRSLKELLLEPGVAAGLPISRGVEHHLSPADRLARSESALYLLDVGVILALFRPTADRAVLDWLAGVPANRLHISAMAVGEIQRVVEQSRAKGTAKDTRDAQEVEEWLLRLRSAYGVLPVDAATYCEWARLMHRRPETAEDAAMVAATALVHYLTVVTDDVEYFESLGVPTVNPFEPRPTTAPDRSDTTGAVGGPHDCREADRMTDPTDSTTHERTTS